ncbi:MAG: PEGA domain-containing protein, partial [Verrucomicrobiota bacterium]
MLKSSSFIYAALLGILTISGCTTFEKGLPQTVNVHSFPSGADVYVNGDYAGVTPYSMELRTKTITGVRIEKSGYQPRRFTIRPRPNADADDLVRFGILYDIGYYQDLVPNPVEVQLPPV